MKKEGHLPTKIDFIWQLIERFQDDRNENDECQDRNTWSDKVLSYNDVENILYEILDEIDPGGEQGK
jgi:hypothetical protein